MKTKQKIVLSLCSLTVLWVGAHDLSLSQGAAYPFHSLLPQSALSRIIFASYNKFVKQLQQQNNDTKTDMNRRQLQAFSRSDFERNICPGFEALAKESASSLDYVREAGGVEKFKCVCDSIEFTIICGFIDLCTTIYPSCENLTLCISEMVRTRFLTGATDGVTRINQNISDPGSAYPGSFIRAELGSALPTCETGYTFAEDGLEYTCDSCEVCENGVQNLNCSNIQPAFVRGCEEDEDSLFFRTDKENPGRFCFPPDNNTTAPKPTSTGMPPLESDLLFETLSEILLATESPSTSPSASPTGIASAPPSVSPSMSPSGLTSSPVSMPTSAGNYFGTISSSLRITAILILVPAFF